LYDDLSDSAESRQAAINLEMAAKPLDYISHQPIIDRPFEEAAGSFSVVNVCLASPPPQAFV